MENSSAVIAEDSRSNSAAEHLGKDDDDDHDHDDAVHMHRSKLFRIDTSKIESVPHCQQNAELQDLDLHVYNQDTFEQGWLLFPSVSVFLPLSRFFAVVGWFICQRITVVDKFLGNFLEQVGPPVEKKHLIDFGQ